MLLFRRMGSALVFAVLASLSFMTSCDAGADSASSAYVIRADHWSAEDERGYEKFIQAIGQSDCNTLDSCLHSAANPFRDSDDPHHRFISDCSDLPYVLRFYYAWKRGLPFSYVAAIAPRGGGKGDIRYSHDGNVVTARADAPRGMNGYQIIDRIRAAVNTGTYRVHPETDGPLPPDFYSPAIEPQSIRPGTVIYDPAGHVAIVFRVDPDGRVHSFDAHTDYTLTQMVFDVRFVRTRPAQGSGFKNWRPQKLVGAKRDADGVLRGGRIELARNDQIADFSVEQFYGNGKRPTDEDWASGTFTVGGEKMNYYDFVRARLAGGKLVFKPIREVRDMVWSICSDLQYRALAVDLAHGMAEQPHPARLPANIYGTYGDWEMYSTPSRDARLKTAFKYLRDTVQRFVDMAGRKDTRHLDYAGNDLPADLLRTYRRAIGYCKVRYRRSNASLQTLSYEEARRRLFAMSFDPYHCPELRWGAIDPAELSSCPDGTVKRAWYEAEQPLRNQIERTYDARMDFSLDDLRKPGPGKGVAAPPDTDVLAYLESVTKQARK